MRYDHHSYIIPLAIRLLSKEKGKRRRLIDIGCADGALTQHFVSLGFETTGIDRRENMIEIARREHPNCSYICKDINTLGLQKQIGLFDIAVAIEVIEHMVNPILFIKQVKSLLKPGGLFLLSTPYHGYIKNTLIALSGAWDKHYDPHGSHVRFFTKCSLFSLLKDEGLDNIKFYGAGRLPFLWKSILATCIATHK